MSEAKQVYDLKEGAKWSRDVEEKKRAIKQLSSLGEKALPSLEEILNVTAYGEIKAICLDAIKSIREGKKKVVGDEKSSASASEVATKADVKKKNKRRQTKERQRRPDQDWLTCPPDFFLQFSTQGISNSDAEQNRVVASDIMKERMANVSKIKEYL